MSEIKISNSAKRQYHIEGTIDSQDWINHCGALLTIAGADGEVSDEEMKWLIDEQISYGATDEVIAEIKRFNWRDADLDDLLKQLGETSLDLQRTLIYQAIKMSRADAVYHDDERAAVMKAAEHFGLTADVTETLHVLVEMEENVDRLRHTVLSRS